MYKFIWFRNDLRLEYNNIFNVIENHEKLIPIFILDSRFFNQDLGYLRKDFLYSCINSLQNEIDKNGSELLLIKGNPEQVWTEIVRNLTIKVYASKDYSPFSKNRDSEVSLALKKYNSDLELIKNNLDIFLESELKTKSGEYYKTFTPFKNELLKKIKANISSRKLNNNKKLVSKSEIQSIKKILKNLDFIDINQLSFKHNQNFPGGEKEAVKRWNDFKNTELQNYHINRNFLFKNGTSKLSPYLKFGCISSIQIAKDCIDFMENATTKDGAEAFLSEIIWREFYKYILEHFPYVEKSSFQEKFDSIKWLEDKDLFNLWCKGQTGYPIVDACMRQLNSIGWMHNRGRMITASFLCKDLHINWKWGELYFKQKLIDFDLSSNNGGWQWVAGIGTDSAPYFRIFNPIEQSKKFDPDGVFIKKWIPELGNIPKKFIHSPWEMDINTQQKHTCIIGKDYPKPIVDHNEARKVTLDLYKNI